MQVYDEKVKPLAFGSGKLPFPLSDAAALLMRLEMEAKEEEERVELKDRWSREINKWRVHGQALLLHVHSRIVWILHDRRKLR